MSDLDLDAIEARAAAAIAATAAVWDSHTSYRLDGGQRVPLILVDQGEMGVAEVSVDMEEEARQPVADFIAACPRDVPALVADDRYWRARAERAEADADRLAAELGWDDPSGRARALRAHREAVAARG